ncbi:MAG TPA: phosphate ABC transporter substrate-binding protein PstS [Terriglobales bacterium]|nr:phosphate ABC transporter substrate-binding protein PstS [Terriglobales bacterium]
MLRFHGYVLAVLAATSLLVGCNSKKSGNESSTGSGTIVAAGSTFVYPVMSRWISDFHAQDAGVEVNYQSIGSGGGIQQLKKGLVGFAASDMALDDQQIKEMPQPVIQIAESAGPVCITYNLPELKEPLKLSDSTLSGIFLGTIKTWQDPKIKKDNPGVTLPKTEIVVAHRSEGSGTTNIFTTYLSAVSPEWKSKVGQGLAVNWPVGIGGKGSEGVTGVVKQTPGSIGYVELTYATTNNLPVALIKNKADQWVKPSAEGTTAAIDAFKDQLAQDIRNPIVDPPAAAKEAYPISGLTFLIIPADGSDKQQRSDIKNFITYVVNNGQATAQSLNYAPIPDSLKQTDLKLLGQMKADGQPLS